MLDASVRATVLNIIKDIREKEKISFIYITHDLSTAYYISDRILVMYKGFTVERGRAKEVFSKPLHPYTELLLDTIPIPDPSKRRQRRVQTFAGATSGEKTLRGCPFYPLCPYRTDKCRSEVPHLLAIEDDHEVACFRYHKT